MIDQNAELIGLVAPEYACPNCGERDMDELVWIDDERVQCQRCKKVYSPGGARDDSTR